MYIYSYIYIPVKRLSAGYAVRNSVFNILSTWMHFVCKYFLLKRYLKEVVVLTF